MGSALGFLPSAGTLELVSQNTPISPARLPRWSTPRRCWSPLGRGWASTRAARFSRKQGLWNAYPPNEKVRLAFTDLNPRTLWLAPLPVRRRPLSGSEVDLRPYVIQQGDHLAKLAYKFGFNADTVWKDPKNAQLRRQGQLSPDPNILNPTDMLYIPDSKPLTTHSLTLGTTNVFVADAPPTVTLTHRFIGDDASIYAFKACVVQELDHLTGLMTDENGVLTFQAPVTLDSATVVFTETGESWALCIGHLDRINTLSGIFQRLTNLGYMAGDLRLDTIDLNLLRAGLRALKVSRSEGATTPLPDSTLASELGVDSPPPSSSNGTTDDAGLSDDGTLDAATTSLLLKTYGC
jgi:hypothetical protein